MVYSNLLARALLVAVPLVAVSALMLVAKGGLARMERVLLAGAVEMALPCQQHPCLMKGFHVFEYDDTVGIRHRYVHSLFGDNHESHG